MFKKTVQKPYTVLVAVIIALVLGGVSATRLSRDLLPEMTLPYMAVITTYPGASPEKVERDVTEILESSLGTVSGVENVTSTSAENYSLVMLEFSDDTNMDSAMVKINTALEEAKSYLPDDCGTPNILEISTDMMATIYASVSYDGMDVYEISDFVEEEVLPEFERLEGVASITSLGLIDQSVEVRLNQEKIDDINEQILQKTNSKLQEAADELYEAENELIDSKSEIARQKNNLESQQESATSQLAEASLALDQAEATKAAYQSQLTSLETQKLALEAELQAYQDNGVEETYATIDSSLAQLAEAMGEMAAMYEVTIPAGIEEAVANEEQFNAFREWMISIEQGDLVEELTYENIKKIYDIVNTRIGQIETELANLETEIAAMEALVNGVNEKMSSLDEQYQKLYQSGLQASASFGSASAQMAAAEQAIENAQQELDNAQETFEDSLKAARENANIDALMTLDTLSGLLYAQNFEMPAGYIDDENDEQWLLKVGENFEELDDLENLVLCNIDDIGDVRLSDVADITVLDNAGDSYEKVNGEQAVVMAIYKNSTAGTSEVSDNCKEAIEELESEYEGLHITELMDQGDYITMFIDSILRSMLIGAVLAVVVLILFLKDVKPTIVVAFSIPFSVLVAIIFMYLGNISLNMMSLAGLAMAIGMLVDNSIVVIENIYRLRARGLEAPRSAVQGTKQVAGAIISSTLTTICVFLPMIFTGGYVRQLMLPFALTIGFALIASLLVALLVVPVVGSVILKKHKETRHPVFERIQKIYAKVLGFCLKVKLIPLALAIALLALSIYEVARMGISVLPDMTTEQISVTATMPEDMDKETAHETADELMEIMMNVENVEMVGVLTNVGSLISSSMSTEDYSNYNFYIVPEEGVTTVAQIQKICDDIVEKTKNMDCEIFTSSSSMSEMSSVMDSGLTIEITGREIDEMLAISEDIMKLLEETEGCTEISNGQEEGDQEIYLNIDKSKAMQDNLTVAQIYQAITDRLTTEKTALNAYLDETEMDINIVDENDLLTVENLLDITFSVDKVNDDGETETEIHTLDEYADITRGKGVASISRENGTRIMTVTASMEEGYNSTLVGREVQEKLNGYEVPKGYTVELAGSTEDVEEMLSQMLQMAALGFVLIYLIMVAQFQSLLSPFIVIFTIPLAFTGGLFGLLFTGEQLTMLSLMGFLVLMGTVVNNGIVFVDYVNQLRIGGMEKRDALIATGRTRMRPILMTALTTILAMCPMVFSQDAGDSMSKGMAIVIVGGMIYATFMTLFIIPVMYDILYRRQPKLVDVGDDTIDDAPDDAAEFIEELKKQSGGAEKHTVS